MQMKFLFFLLLQILFLNTFAQNKIKNIDPDSTKLRIITMKEKTQVKGYILSKDSTGIKVISIEVGLIHISWSGIQSIDNGNYSRIQKKINIYSSSNFEGILNQSAILKEKKELTIFTSLIGLPSQKFRYSNNRRMANIYLFNQNTNVIIPIGANFSITKNLNIEAGFMPMTILNQFDYYLKPKMNLKITKNLHFGLDLNYMKFKIPFEEDNYYGFNHFGIDTNKHIMVIEPKLTLGNHDLNLTFSTGIIYEKYSALKHIHISNSNGYGSSYTTNLTNVNGFSMLPLINISGFIRAGNELGIYLENRLIPNDNKYNYWILFGFKIINRITNLDLGISLYNYTQKYTVYGATTSNIYSEKQRSFSPHLKLTFKI